MKQHFGCLGLPALLLVSTLIGCASDPSSQTANKAIAETARDQLIECIYQQTTRLERSGESADAVADAALALCASYESQYVATNQVGNRYQFTQAVRDANKRHAKALVVEIRTKSSAPTDTHNSNNRPSDWDTMEERIVRSYLECTTNSALTDLRSIKAEDMPGTARGKLNYLETMVDASMSQCTLQLARYASHIRGRVKPSQGQTAEQTEAAVVDDLRKLARRTILNMMFGEEA